MSFLYIFQKGGRLAPYWAKCPPPLWGKMAHPLQKLQKIFCINCIPIVSLYQFSVILTLFHKYNVGKHDTEDKNVTHVILAELMGHFTPNEILQQIIEGGPFDPTPLLFTKKNFRLILFKILIFFALDYVYKLIILPIFHILCFIKIFLVGQATLFINIKHSNFLTKK